jgi:PilZ domain
MTLPQFNPHRQERRETRYPLHLPVMLKMARQEMRARSENISLGGILLSSDLLIPEGATVEVEVGVAHTPDPGILLSARGKVLRVQPKLAGDYAVAIRLERSFELPFAGSKSAGVTLANAAYSRDRENIRRKGRGVFYRAPYLASWHTET